MGINNMDGNDDSQWTIEDRCEHNIACSLAHNIRNKLDSIGWSLQRLEHAAKNNSPSRQITDFLDDFNVLTENLYPILTLIQLAPGMELFSPYKAVKSALSVTSPRLSRLEIKMIEKYEEDDRKLCGSQKKLVLVLCCLLNNAIEAIHDRNDKSAAPDNYISVGVKSTLTHISITVIDNGAGIKAEHKKHIFSSQFSTRRNRQGIGLLYSQHVIKNLFHGSLALKDNGKNETIFEIVIPYNHD